MNVGLHFSNYSMLGDARNFPSVLADTAVAAEKVGVATFTVMDHWFQMEPLGRAQDPMLEGWTTLAFLAARTEAIELATLVSGVTYRYPGLLAKIATTLDVLSGGRALLGIGAAWYEREHHGLGVRFPSLTERYERLEETLQICLQMWSDEDGPFRGKHYQLDETICSPAPVRRPPILIGGSGERKTLRLVARYADACNLFAGPPPQMGHKLDVLRRHCDEVGRDYEQIRKTIIVDVPALDDERRFVAQMRACAALGVQQVWVNPVGSDPAGWVRSKLGKIVPELVEL